MPKTGLNSSDPDQTRGTISRAALIVAMSAVGLGAVAQTAEDGANLDLSFGLRGGTNSGAFAGASLDYATSTRAQKFSFELNTLVTSYEDDDFDLKFADPRAALSFARDNGAIKFSSTYSIVRSSIDGFSEGLVEVAGLTVSDFVSDPGTRTVQNANVTFELGARARAGLTTTFALNDVNFADTADPDFIDRRTGSLTLNGRLNVSPVLQALPGYRISVEDREDAQNTRVTSQTATLGASMQANPVTTISAGLSYTRIETETDTGAGGRNTDTTNGLGFNLSGQITQKGVTTGLAYNRRLETSGVQDQLTLTRSQELTKTDDLSYSIGVARYGATDDTGFIGNLNFQRELSNGSISLSAGQTLTVTDQDQNALTSNLRASYATELTSVSSLTAAASFSRFDSADPAEADLDSASLSLTYEHSLTRDWSVAATATARRTREDGTRTESDQNLQLTLNHAFSLF